jgi:hypothetical protein
MVKSFNTRMVGVSPNPNPNRCLPAVRRKRFRQVTTRSLGTRSNGGGLNFSLLVSFWFLAVGFQATRAVGDYDDYDDDDKRRLLMP